MKGAHESLRFPTATICPVPVADKRDIWDQAKHHLKAMTLPLSLIINLIFAVKKDSGAWCTNLTLLYLEKSLNDNRTCDCSRTIIWKAILMVKGLALVWRWVLNTEMKMIDMRVKNSPICVTWIPEWMWTMITWIIRRCHWELSSKWSEKRPGSRSYKYTFKHTDWVVFNINCDPSWSVLQISPQCNSLPAIDVAVV